MSKYEGWENYQTWATSLWFSNDQGLYEIALDAVRQARGNPIELQTIMKDTFEELFEEQLDIPSGPVSDILGHAVQCIDWREISQHWATYWEDMKDEYEDEDEDY